MGGVTAGRDVTIQLVQVFTQAPSSAPAPSVEAAKPILNLLAQRGAGLGEPESSDERLMSEIDKGLTPAIDANRDLLVQGDARRAAVGLNALLANLPSGASTYTAFRIKANIGHCHFQVGEREEAFRWFEDAVATAPTEPRSIAMQAYVMLASNDAAGAFAFAKAQLEIDPTNEHLAGHLVEAAVFLKDGTDPEPLVPTALLECERVLIARCVLHRLRGDHSAWRRLAQLGASRFPEHRILRLLAAEATVEEIANDCRGTQYRQMTPAERTRLQIAASHLQTQWLQIKSSEVPNRDDGLEALTAAMIARTLLDECDSAMSLARDVIERTNDEQALTMAAQMAQILDDSEVAELALAKLPDRGPAAFLKAMAACNRNDWALAASLLTTAEIPEQERLFAEMITRLGAIGGMDDAGAHEALTDALQRFSADARALVILGGMAGNKRLPELASQAYEYATALIGPDMPSPARIMIASQAYRRDDFDVVIRALDGHIETGAWSRVLQWLVDAHAAEQPPRRRNLKFFKGLPKAVRNLPLVARAHASKLLDLKQAANAEPILRSVVAQSPDDVFAQLKLAQALDELGRHDDAKALVVAADEASMKGPGAYLLQWAHRLRDAGALQRALAYAYDLLRSRATDYRMALGYVSLVFAQRGEFMIPTAERVATGTWVAIDSSDGEHDAFVIDDGPSFLGIDVVPASVSRAQRVIGLSPGGKIEVAGLAGKTVTWNVREVKDKHLAVLHQVMETFERRFPTANGLWRIELKGQDVQPVLDVIREQAKAKQEITQRLYVENRIPLAFASRAVGTDVMSFAFYLRAIGFEIATGGATAAEVQAGIDTAKDYRGAGATLDTYTAITAAEMAYLDVLETWFGKLAVPASTVELIDRMIEQTADSLGKEAMSLGWKDGIFFREEVNDDILRQRINQLEVVKAGLAKHCEVVAVLMPDDLPAEVAEFARTTGREGIDAMYLAASRGDVLVSDDLFYRQIAGSLAKVDSTWLQVTFLAAHVDGEIDQARYAKGCAQLAFRRHSNLWIDDDALLVMSDSCSEPEFAAICQYIGSRNAEMWSHAKLVAKFIDRIWRRPAPRLKREILTSAVLSALLRHRREDWHWYLALVWLGLEGHRPLMAYLLRWIDGHFLPVRPVEEALREWRYYFGQRLPSSGAASREALEASKWPLGPIVRTRGRQSQKDSTSRLKPEPEARSIRSMRRRRDNVGPPGRPSD